MRILLLMISAVFAMKASGALFINEVIASNNNGIQDDFFQYNDWIEIYNNGGIVNLAGYYLTDDPNDLMKWQIPATNAGLTTVLPNSYILFWIDNDIDQGEDHVGFSLSANGESVLLVQPDGVTIVDQIDYPAQQTDISYGRECDGCSEWIFFDIPTPDATNNEVLPAPALLFINEVMVSNTSYISDAQGEYAQWFEVYNPNNFQVNLADYGIAVNGGTSFTVSDDDPTRTTIPANGFQLFWCDGELNQGTDHIDQTLPLSSGSITLLDVSGNTVDTYNYTGTADNTSWGRAQDGSVTSTTFTAPTPRFSNQLVFIEPPLLYINELMTDNTVDTLDTHDQYEDWFEIYNPNNFAVDLAGYWLSDNFDNPMKWMVPTDHPDSSVIAPGGFVLFFCDEQQSQGWNHTSFRLNNAGETLTLRSPDGFTIADQIAYPQQYADTTYGRLTDGSPQWVYFVETTPEYSNNGATVNVVEAHANDFLVFPNPSLVGSRVNFNMNVDWILLDSRGVQVSNGLNSNGFTCPDVATGLYFILINGQSTAKLLISN